ncbi:MAG: hypothetical protein U0176_11970 [Bacteroidia bacterium]
MKKKEVREILEGVMFPFLQAEFGMSRVRDGSDHIFAKLDVEIDCASPVLLILVTGSEFGYRVSPILSMSSKTVDRPGNVRSKKRHDLLNAIYERMRGKDTRYTFVFTTEEELRAYLDELMAFLKTEGRKFWERFATLASIERYLNADPTIPVEYGFVGTARAKDALTLAKMMGRTDLEELEAAYLKLFEHPRQKGLVTPNAIKEFLEYSKWLRETQ